MAKYVVDWKEVEPEEAGTLMDVVARYMSGADYPKVDDILNILCIKKKEDKKDNG